jgi:short-subunit dehydrogenase involved in D-alanine esterification of teichoic acids
MSFLPKIPEPLRMLATNPSIFDFSTDGPIAYVCRQKLTAAPKNPPPMSLISKTVLVTGATSGVGQEAARQFLALGAKVILGVRNTSKGEVVMRDLLECNPKGEVEVLEVDLESFASVDAFAAILKTRLDHLDIAVMNAGLFSRIQGVSADGYNVLLQVCKEVIPCFVDTTSRFLNPFSRLIS